jgi:hypothetical protein
MSTPGLRGVDHVHPVRLRQELGRDVVGLGAVGELDVLLVRLVVVLELVLVDERRELRGFELRGDSGLLLLGRLRHIAVRGRRRGGAHVDRDLGAVVPVALHLVDLHLQENRGAHERERDERHEHDRDDHREVAAEALAHLRHDESESHWATSVP